MDCGTLNPRSRSNFLQYPEGPSAAGQSRADRGPCPGPAAPARSADDLPQELKRAALFPPPHTTPTFLPRRVINVRRSIFTSEDRSCSPAQAIRQSLFPIFHRHSSRLRSIRELAVPPWLLLSLPPYAPRRSSPTASRAATMVSSAAAVAFCAPSRIVSCRRAGFRASSRRRSRMGAKCAFMLATASALHSTQVMVAWAQPSVM